jgi:sulfite exporter TauE/SafE
MPPSETAAAGRSLRGPVVAIALLALVALLLTGYYYTPDESRLDGGENLLLVFLTGLTVGGLSCLAIQAGLLAAAVARPEDAELRGHEKRLRQEAALQGNATPIVVFLSAKLVAYTALGGLLGWLGSLIAPSPTLRGIVMVLTALFMIAVALHLLGVHPVFRYVIIQPPHFLTRRIRSHARSRAAFAPAVLGAATIFLPCGFTQAMQLLAINSGSPMQGAAIMFAFILGTSPVFFLLGYTTTKLGAALHRRFMQAAALVIVALGLYTLNASMNLLQVPVSYESLKDAVSADGTRVLASRAADGVQEVRIHAGAHGYSPARTTIASGRKTRVIFVSEPGAGCSRAVIIKGRQLILPQHGETVLALPAQEPGTIKYVCTMGMYRGSIKVT